MDFVMRSEAMVDAVKSLRQEVGMKPEVAFSIQNTPTVMLDLYRKRLLKAGFPAEEIDVGSVSRIISEKISDLRKKAKKRIVFEDENLNNSGQSVE